MDRIVKREGRNAGLDANLPLDENRGRKDVLWGRRKLSSNTNTTHEKKNSELYVLQALPKVLDRLI